MSAKQWDATNGMRCTVDGCDYEATVGGRCTEHTRLPQPGDIKGEEYNSALH